MVISGKNATKYVETYGDRDGRGRGLEVCIGVSPRLLCYAGLGWCWCCVEWGWIVGWVVLGLGGFGWIGFGYRLAWVGLSWVGSGCDGLFLVELPRIGLG